MNEESKEDDDEEALVSAKDRFEFWAENFISANSMNKFYVLLFIAAGCALVHASLFALVGGADFVTAAYWIVQTIATGSFNDEFTNGFQRLVYLSSIVWGILVFTILVGFVNEYIMSMMRHMSEGKSRIACTDHTLLLGWNESTVRCVCQLALLRSAYLKQNELWSRRIFPWTRIKPSTPLAAGKIVIMCNTKEKGEMDHVLQKAFVDRGISPHRTRVGTDVICRVGDPSEPHDLVRVGAHLAAAILSMMTEEDDEEEHASGGVLSNGISLKTLLAVKSVLVKHRSESDTSFWEQFRMVVHLEADSPTIEAAMHGGFVSPSGHQLAHALDLRSLINSMLFSCAINPALPDVMLELLNYNGSAFRAMDAADLRLVGKRVGDCALIWEDAVFCGVVDKDTNLTEDEPVFAEGLACDPCRVIGENDRVIFVGRTFCPKPSQSGRVPRFLGHVARPGKRYIDTLVCGWRKEWIDGPRLAHRIAMLVEGTCPGSNIVFLNRKEDFPSILSSAIQKQGNHWLMEGVRVWHILGDSGDVDTLRHVMQNPNSSLWQGDKFEVVIVLGTSSSPLPKKSQDLRMLSTYVLVHKIHKEVFGDAMLHVIGENQFDSTSTLAHAVTWKDSTKDLINTQAVFARGLAQALAFPRMQPAVAQLFNDTPGTPQLRMFMVGEAMIPAGVATFADITRTIVEHAEMSGAVCLGVVLGGDEETLLAPAPDESIKLVDGDLIAVIERGPLVVKRDAPRYQRTWAQSRELSRISFCDDDTSGSDETDPLTDHQRGMATATPFFNP